MFSLSCLFFNYIYFFFHKMIKLYQDIWSTWLSRTSTDRFCHRLASMRCNNTTEISSIYWNMLLWVFSNWLDNSIMIKFYHASPVTWQYQELKENKKKIVWMKEWLRERNIKPEKEHIIIYCMTWGQKIPNITEKL